MTRHVLVSGASGYVGSALIRSADWDITAIDDLSTNRYVSYFNLPRPVWLIEEDLLEADLPAIVQGHDACVHLAALTDAANSLGKADAYYAVNAEGTNRLAAACREAGVPLLYLSSTSVYGEQDSSVDEATPYTQMCPGSPYADSKLAGERILRELHAHYGLRFATLRCGTIYGTHGGKAVGWRNHTAVNRWCWQAAHQQPLTIYAGAWDSLRPYLWLTEAIETIKGVVEENCFDGSTRNVLSGNHTPREVTDLIGQYTPIVRQQIASPLLNQVGYEVRSIYAGASPATAQQNGRAALEAGVKETLTMLNVHVANTPAAEAQETSYSAGPGRRLVLA